jgi:pimeloyl-ACP methyl ester carboxylesterase
MHRWLRRALWVGGGGLALSGALAAANRALTLDDLPPTLPGAMHDWRWRGWRVRYTTLGAGPPIVLLHGLHPAASSFELRNLFEPLSQAHRVYAVDLLGFGKSERPAAPYSGSLYAELLADFLTRVVGEPAVVLAPSLSAAYAVDAARSRPGLIDRLVLIAPATRTRTSVLGRALGRLVGSPLLGTAAFNMLVSRAGLRRALRAAYADPALVDDAVVEQQWATAHQPNARLAPAALQAGRLDRPLSRSAKRIAAPILVLRGDRPHLRDELPDDELQRLGSDVTIETVAGAGQLPHDEAADRVVALVEAWLAGRS